MGPVRLRANADRMCALRDDPVRPVREKRMPSWVAAARMRAFAAGNWGNFSS